MVYKTIEFVCAGNNGRSPVAEAVGRKLLQELKIESRMNIFSTGTIVDTTNLRDLGMMLRPLAEAPVNNGLILPDRIKKLESNPNAVLGELIAIEEGWRNRYIAKDIGLDYTGHIRRQTIASPEERLILPVDKANLARVRAIYESFSYNPTIENLSTFTEGDIELHQVDVRDYGDYRALAEQVAMVAKRAVLKAMRS